MANILYGVNGEGAGHSTRSREVLTHLVAMGHKVHVASFDRGLANLRDGFDVTEIFGLRFEYVNNRVRYKRTIAKNLFTAPKAARSVRRLMELTEEWKTNLVITDFEPITCHVAHRKRLPVITIDNQHCLTNTDVAIPREFRRDAAAAKLVCRLMTPRAEASLVTTFFMPNVRKSKTFLFPPILRQEILRAKPTDGDAVLIYVTSPAPALANALGSVRAEFIAYGFGREGREGNVIFKRPSMEGFLKDLITAKAIIANAGFSLVTEALHLGKPYLAVPVAHQFEQTFNAYYLARMEYGAWWEDLNKERIESFLYNLPLYRERLAKYPRQGNEALFAKLDALIGEYTAVL
ncbi:MAG TPA: glycosyltransferase family protein [Candidatus Koribacter sp.]